jgi:cytochrome c551/c552
VAFGRAAASVACLTAILASPVCLASAQLALDKGCMTCHGNPPKKNTPSFQALAAQLAPYKNQPGADQKLADKLREHHVFGSIRAHENLTPESSLALVRWIIQGAQ